MSATNTDVLVIPKAEIRHWRQGHPLLVCLRQWRVERALRRRGVRFRSVDPEQVAAAYATMSAADFDAINGPQDWANWRTIPRCLNGRVPDQPLKILDLGSGTGSSLRALAWHAPIGSELTGYEAAAPIMAVARRQSYVHRGGKPAHVDFVCQTLTEPLRVPAGTQVAQHSVDVVNASGVIGHHVNQQTITPLIEELQRVLRPTGIAMLDVGPTLSKRELTKLMDTAGFHKLAHCRSWWLDPTGQVVYRK